MRPRKKNRKIRLHQIDQRQLRLVQQAIADLVKMGLVEDSGERDDDGRIVWRVTQKNIELSQKNPKLLEELLDKGPEGTD